MKSRLLTKISDLGIQAEIYPTHRIIRDDYEDEPEDFKYNPKVIFESSGARENVCCIPTLSFTNIKYFIDGSRRTYVIGYMTYGEKFLPIVAGQAGAACCLRKDKRLKKVELDKNIYLLLPNVMESYEISKISQMLKSESIIEVNVETYKYKEEQNKPPVEFAIAKLNKIMQEKELAILKFLTVSKKLNSENLAVIDGSLQFQKTKDVNFDNVIGISKTYRVNLSGITKPKKRHLGVVLKDLDYGYRTPVFQVKDSQIGFWFLRIRRKKALMSPLDGIIKIEMFTQGNDDVLDSAMVDNISMFLVLERNPVCYGSDNRWQNLLYPIYLTEKLLKGAFLSDRFFINLF
jgi:hypothetical protein